VRFHVYGFLEWPRALCRRPVGRRGSDSAKPAAPVGFENSHVAAIDCMGEYSLWSQFARRPRGATRRWNSVRQPGPVGFGNAHVGAIIWCDEIPAVAHANESASSGQVAVALARRLPLRTRVAGRTEGQEFASEVAKVDDA